MFVDRMVSVTMPARPEDFAEVMQGQEEVHANEYWSRLAEEVRAAWNRHYEERMAQFTIYEDQRKKEKNAEWRKVKARGRNEGANDGADDDVDDDVEMQGMENEEGEMEGGAMSTGFAAVNR